MKGEFRTYIFENESCSPPSVNSEKSIIKEWLKTKMERKPLSMKSINKGIHEDYTLFEMKQIRNFFTIGQIQNFYYNNSNRDQKSIFKENWKGYLAAVVVLILLLRACSGCFSSSNSQCLDENDLTHAWKASHELNGDKADVKLILNDDATFEVINYGLNSGSISSTNSGTWTFECRESHKYEFGEIVSTEYKNWVYLKGESPYYRVTTTHVFQDTWGNWTLSALPGMGFAIDSDLFFKK